MQQEKEIRTPTTAHLHVRQEEVLETVAPITAAKFGQALIMPNTIPPIVTAADAREYRAKIRHATEHVNPDFIPRMALYATDDTTPAVVEEAFASIDNIGLRAADVMKLYPVNVTTNSSQGVSNLGNLNKTFERMEELQMPLCVHAEVNEWNGKRVPQEDRERVFIENLLYPTYRRFEGLKIVLEHVSTQEGVEFVLNTGSRVGATITPHHLIYTTTDIFDGGMRPHLCCMPIIKEERHKEALRRAITLPVSCQKFFAGGDSAPHLIESVPGKPGKHSHKVPSGVFCAPVELEAYAMAFEEVNGSLDERFENFVSFNACAFYGWDVPKGTVLLKRETWTINEPVTVEDVGTIHPMFYEPEPERRKKILWRIR